MCVQSSKEMACSALMTGTRELHTLTPDDSAPLQPQHQRTQPLCLHSDLNHTLSADACIVSYITLKLSSSNWTPTRCALAGETSKSCSSHGTDQPNVTLHAACIDASN